MKVEMKVEMKKSDIIKYVGISETVFDNIFASLSMN